jgi:hypothetical protein
MHELENLGTRGFAIQLLIDEWKKTGNHVVLGLGTDALPDADLAILHVNLSLVPEIYAEAARVYPVVVNLGALDIRKRSVSRNILTKEDDWGGPVIVKTDENCGGVPEWIAWRRRVDLGLPAGAEPKPLIKYRLYRHKDRVPDFVWTEPRRIVERFLPETDGDSFYLRTWIFFGDRERCRRFTSKKPLIKGSDYLAFQDAPVPEMLREERKRLGFDYGKFDFVIHAGQPVLLDVNKTPGIPPRSRPQLREAYAQLAGGIDPLLKRV